MQRSSQEAAPPLSMPMPLIFDRLEELLSSRRANCSQACEAESCPSNTSPHRAKLLESDERCVGRSCYRSSYRFLGRGLTTLAKHFIEAEAKLLQKNDRFSFEKLKSEAGLIKADAGAPAGYSQARDRRESSRSLLVL